MQQDLSGLRGGILGAQAIWSAGKADPAEAEADRAAPSGWWLLPGLVMGLGLWVLIGAGVQAMLAGPRAPAAEVTRMQADIAGVTPAK